MNVDDIEEIANAQAKEETPITHCDQCGQMVDPGERITTYTSSTDYVLDLPPDEMPLLTMQRTFCENCDRTEILLPHRGTLEILYGTHLDEDRYRVPDHRVLDYSARDAGVEFDPVETWFRITKIPLSEVTDTWTTGGPGDVVNQLAISGIDLRRFVSDDGRQLDLTDEEVAELHETYVASIANRNTPASEEWEQIKSEMADLGKQPPGED